MELEATRRPKCRKDGMDRLAPPSPLTPHPSPLTPHPSPLPEVIMPTMDHIQELTRQYAERRAKLAETVAALQADIESAKRERMRWIKHHLSLAMEAQLVLADAIDASRELFERPRTHAFHGVKVGLQKSPGRVEMDDPGQVVDLIRKRLPGDFDRLVKITYTPVKSAIAELSASDLARIGCTVADTGDTVLIRPADGEVDKIVDALLKDHLEGVEA